MEIQVSLDYEEFTKKPDKEQAKVISLRIAGERRCMELTQIAVAVGDSGRTFCPAVFTGRNRKAEEFAGMQLFTLDFDKGISYQEVRIRVAKLILIMLMKIFPECDTQCSDLSRMFYGGKGLIEQGQDTFNIVRLAISFQAYLRQREESQYKRNLDKNTKRRYEHIISVSKTLLYQKLGGDEAKTFHVGPPKTESSVRTVPMNEACEQALRKQLHLKRIMAERYEKADEFKDILFVTKFNTPICATVYNDAIKRIVNESNLQRDETERLPVFSAHTFRHTFATRCIEAGILPKTVQKYLGHANRQMTMDLYVHITDEFKREDGIKNVCYLWTQTMLLYPIYIGTLYPIFLQKDGKKRLILPKI